MTLLAFVQQPHWHRSAACADTDVDTFFGGKANEATALALCGLCTVRDECASETFAIERHVGNVFGVRAGMTASERLARLRR